MIIELWRKWNDISDRKVQDIKNDKYETNKNQDYTIVQVINFIITLQNTNSYN